MQQADLSILEGESIRILREATAAASRPVMLYSAGKDSTVMLHLARKAFFPASPPFPLLHVDTDWKFRAMYRTRDRAAAAAGMTLIVHRNPDAVRQGINPFDHPRRHTEAWKTDGLKQALADGGVDTAFGGARRDEEASRAKERVVSVRSRDGRWDPHAQRPEPWHLFNLHRGPGESLRVFPLSDWTELDIWRYVERERLDVGPLYFAAPRPTVRRGDLLLVVDDDRFRLLPGERPELRTVRFRTLGCYPLTGAIESEAASVAAVIAELGATRSSERQGRSIDRDPGASMEAKKRMGYF